MNNAEHLKRIDCNNMTDEEMAYAREYAEDEQVTGRQEEIEQALCKKYTDKGAWRQIYIDMQGHDYSNIKEVK